VYRTSAKSGKKPRNGGAFFYRPVPDPGPDGVSVDPLGEELGPTVLPDGFMLVLEPFAEPAVLPVELPLPLMVLPLDPVVPPTLPPLIPAAPPAEPPPAEPPPAPPPACAYAKVLESAKAEARANVFSFMLIFSWVESTINRGGIICSSCVAS
jgi:hypothetical protein